MMDFKELFSRTDSAVKMEFLEQALLKNENLRNQFTKFCQSQKPTSVRKKPEKASEKIISQACDELKSELEVLDFEDIDWRDYTPRHGRYIEDYEAVENFAEDQLTEIFDVWKKNICSTIQNGQLEHAVCQCLGTYDACLQAEISGSEDIFEDLTETLLQDHREIMIETVDVMNTTVKSEEQAILAIEAVLDHYMKNYRGIRNYLRYFEPLLLCLTETGSTAGEIRTRFESYGIDESFVPRLAVKLASFDQDAQKWRKKAE